MTKWYERNRRWAGSPRIHDEFGHEWWIAWETGVISVFVNTGSKCSCAPDSIPLVDLEWTLTRNQKNIKAMLEKKKREMIAEMKTLCQWSFTKDMDPRLEEDFTEKYCSKKSTKVIGDRPYCDDHHPMSAADKVSWADSHLAARAAKALWHRQRWLIEDMFPKPQEPKHEDEFSQYLDMKDYRRWEREKREREQNIVAFHNKVIAGEATIPVPVPPKEAAASLEPDSGIVIQDPEGEPISVKTFWKRFFAS